MTQEKLDKNHCDQCNENFSTIMLKYSNTKYWLCDDCYTEHLKEDETMEVA